MQRSFLWEGSARKVLGRNVITPQWLVSHAGESYSVHQLGVLERMLPTEEQLELCHAEHMMLTAAPGMAKSVVEICGSGGSRPCWYAANDQRFAHDPFGLCWLALPLRPREEWFGGTWESKQQFLTGRLQALTAAKLAWCLKVYRLAYGTSHLAARHVWSSSLAKTGERVALALQGEHTVVLPHSQRDNRMRPGVLPARQFNQERRIA